MTPSARPSRKVRTAIVGLGFGAEFIPIHQRHPHAELVAICQRSQDKLDRSPRRTASSGDISTTPTSSRTRRSTRSISIRRSPTTRHVAGGSRGRQARHVHGTDGHECGGLQEDRRPRREDGTQVHDGRDGRLRAGVLFIKQMADRGDLGKIQFVQASHQQDMDGWPNYWPGLPPDALRDALRRALPGTRAEGCRGGELFWFRANPRGTHQALRLTVCRGERPRETRSK